MHSSLKLTQKYRFPISLNQKFSLKQINQKRFFGKLSQLHICPACQSLKSHCIVHNNLNNNALFLFHHETKSFHMNLFNRNAENVQEAQQSQENIPELPIEVQEYLKKNSPITLQEGIEIQSLLLEKVKVADFSSIQSLPHDSVEKLQIKWIKSLEAISSIRKDVLNQFTQFNGDEERLKVWLGRLSNHSEKIRKAQDEFTSVLAEKLFGIPNFETNITDSRAIGIFYKADKIVQEELIQREEFASKSLRDFAKGNIFDEQTQFKLIFPRLLEEELKLLKLEQEEQNEYRADIRNQVEQARKEYEASGNTLNLIEDADRIQKELNHLDSPLGWIEYKLQLGQAYYRFG